MPSKPSKYGAKFWMLADAKSYYVSYASMCTGKDQTADCGSSSFGEKVVINATRHVSEGRNITTNNFFTSLSLAGELSKQNLTLLGTVRSHRQEVPFAVELLQSRALLQQISDNYDSLTAIQLMSYKAKKKVYTTTVQLTNLMNYSLLQQK